MPTPQAFQGALKRLCWPEVSTSSSPHMRLAKHGVWWRLPQVVFAIAIIIITPYSYYYHYHCHYDYHHTILINYYTFILLFLDYYLLNLYSHH